MVKILRLAAVILFIGVPFFYAQAQSGFIEESVWSNIDPTTGNSSDFIITQDGSKIFGEIAHDYDYSDYEEVTFDIKGNVKTYFPSDLQAFGLENGRFFMCKRLPDSPILEFVQILFSGKLQLDFRKGKYYLDNGKQIQQLRVVKKTLSVGVMSNTRRIKVHSAILKNATLGKCQEELKYLIENADVKENDFIEILEKYHNCEGLPYKIHLDKIPVAKISFTFGLGTGMQFLHKNNPVGRKSSLENPLFYQGFIGLRIHEFRTSPKISVDLRAEYQQSSTSWKIDESNASLIVTGSSTFDQKTLAFPVSLNYSVFKTEQVDIYFGAKAGLLFNKVESDEGTISVTYTHNNKTDISYAPIVDYSKLVLVPGVKIGANFSMGAEKKLFAEIQADYAFNMYQTLLVLYNKPLETNAVFVSLKLGFEL
ncbi:hypothetical protein SAMN04489724_2744 [Algoriphagus locisalis]|uniref:Outer membrane protein beta-barrel domain-containing protein n=1 Tax=Algoriphagus locisalis TaxID=305507 RepID=A0A1I7BV53_9BACT|nr:hypothetical protein SAMN04489724_2744 [Algoriphagus locisalis]